MKRWLGTLLALVVGTAALCPACRAASGPYVFAEWDMEVTVPEGDYYVFLRDMDPESPTLSDTGLTAEQVNALMEPGNIYLDALYFDGSYELVVMVRTDEDYETVFDYALMGKELRDEAAEGIKRGLEDKGATVSGGVSWYEGDEAVFAVMEIANPDASTLWSYQYFTVYNGRGICVSASSITLDGPTEEIKEQVRLLAEGVHFTRKLPVPQSVLDAYKETGEEEARPIWDTTLGGVCIGAAAVGLIWLVWELWIKRQGKKSAAADAAHSVEKREEWDDEHRQ